MIKWSFMILVLVLCFFTISANAFQAQTGKVLPPDVNEKLDQADIKIAKDYGKMPLYFIPNKGQLDNQVYYYVQGKDKTVYFTPEGLTYSLNAPGGSEPFYKMVPTLPKIFDSLHWVVKLEFVGARKSVKPECLEQSGTVVSYFKGKSEQWKAGLQTASKIIYRELWPGIDLIYYGTINKMKYEFIVHPGADPSQIKLAYHGAESVEENSLGQLEVQTPMGDFFDDTPLAWQEIAGRRESVSLKYALEKKPPANLQNACIYGFSVGEYDKTQTLVLDPVVLIYCGYVGGSGAERGYEIAVDGSGCAYIAGYTISTETDFPVTVGPDLTYNGADLDVFVAKVRADGTGLVYCGYIGGSDRDYGYGIAVDALGRAYVSGGSNSTETTFPVTGGPDLTQNGNTDVFVARVNAAGTALDFCGYIGGLGPDTSMDMAIDASGCIYIAGYTWSSESYLPVTAGPDLTFNGGYDCLVAKVKANGTGLDYCGYIGGSSSLDFAYAIAVDGAGCAYVTGSTQSDQTSFPVTVGPDLTFNGGLDEAFVAKVKADGTGLDYCGYIGGTGDDFGFGIAVDGLGCAYVKGYTDSNETSFPVAVGPDLTNNGGTDSFIAKVNAAGTALDYCGFIGGVQIDYGTVIAVDGSGCAYAAGYTLSNETSFPVTTGPDITHNGGWDVYIAKVKANGTGLDYCGYLGGSSDDRITDIALDNSGSVYMVGYTNSTETTFPVNGGPDLTYNGGTFDAFVAKISDNPTYTVNFAAGNGGSLTGATSQSVAYGSNCTAVEAIPNAGYQFFNWTGTGSFVTSTDNPLTVANVNGDMMITANFIHSNPAGWSPLVDFQNNMIVYGKAYIGNNPAMAGDWLGAFGPGGVSDCRGIAAVQSNGNYYLTIGSNENSGETITFQLWPIPSGPSIAGSESIAFITDGVYDGLLLHFGPRSQNIALVNGWNWISFNTLPADTAFNSVFGTPGVIEQIKSQTQAALYSGGNWIGDLTDMSGIANGIMYKVKTNQAYSFSVTGMTVPYGTPLSLVTGWNWTAYLPTLKQPVADAVNSILTPVSQVKSQIQSVIKIGSILFGDLVEMEPNKGYTILMNQAGVLQYPQGVSVFPDRSNRKADTMKTRAVPWSVIKGNQYNMVATGTVYFEGKPVNTSGYYLAGIGPKGETDARSISPVKTDGSYFATILGNTGGETVKFKLLNNANGKTYDVAGSLQFQPDNLQTGFDLKARSIKVTAPALGTVMRMGTTCTITWDAYEMNNVKIELYKGGSSLMVIAPSLPAGSHTYHWTIPGRMTAGSDFKIKVTCIDTGVIAGDSSRAFTIKPMPTLTLLSPNGGELLQVKHNYDIMWRSTGIDNIKIELYKGTVLQKVISAKTPAATGKYTWVIPANHSLGITFKIKITSVDTGLNLSDTGDRYFSITGNTSTGSDSAKL